MCLKNAKSKHIQGIKVKIFAKNGHFPHQNTQNMKNLIHESQSLGQNLNDNCVCISKKKIKIFYQAWFQGTVRCFPQSYLTVFPRVKIWRFVNRMFSRLSPLTKNFIEIFYFFSNTIKFGFNPIISIHS